MFVIMQMFGLHSSLDLAMGEQCTEVYGYAHRERTRTFHCSFGCCGPHYDQYCCVSHAGVIVGIVFACIFGIAFISACVCCFIKHQSARSRSVRPSAGMVSQAVIDGTVNGQTTTQTNVFILPSTGPPAYSSVYYNPYSQTPSAPPPYPPMLPAYDVASGPPPAYTSPPPPPGYEEVGGGKLISGRLDRRNS
ncbi:hypothetical protein PoB_005038400 [Plakobranchus ocellatus]|uniref:Vesicular, overexpressed in cancer, prosurvival protein 1 n=1 Tax=Plakobranchus ocellatus TaxID=259542 RepID=A0AAV4BZP9_9GAST|nr:hypothetical protein PoB_005038400 [Plakobranchus ocellatus]